MPKYATVVCDSIGEQARLYFSKAIGKTADQSEASREITHYRPTTERLNIWIRRAEDLKKSGTNLVLIGHEQIDKIYATGGMIGEKGRPPQEPVGVRGMPDLPGQAFPEELLRKCDVILRMRILNGKPTWVAKEEPLSAGVPDAHWIAGARFNAGLIANGYLPPSYQLIKAEAEKLEIPNWLPPYIWMIYGKVKIGKTRVVAESFPKPMKYFDFDKGTSVLGPPETIKAMGIDVVQYRVEEKTDYDLFIKDFATCY
jgi:hypothetical protein